MTFARLSTHKPKSEETSSAKSRLANSKIVKQKKVKPPQIIPRPQINIDMTQIPTLASETSPALENPVQMKLPSQIRAKTTIENSSVTLQAKETETINKTGLPDRLKSGIENLSGYSMDNVRVHYNSNKPSQLQAHAYAQGTDIHIAPRQEKHLPHEAWHVVQQMQGRVKPTMQAQEVAINDDRQLEKDADVMGAKALKTSIQSAQLKKVGSSCHTAQRVIPGLDKYKNSNEIPDKWIDAYIKDIEDTESHLNLADVKLVYECLTEKSNFPAGISLVKTGERH